MIDCRGDIIMQYWSTGYDSVYMARFGLDGTLKHKAAIPNALYDVYGMGVLKESPLEYWQWRGIGNANLAVYVLDSAFHLQNTVVINKFLRDDFVEIEIDTLAVVIEVREYLDFDNDTEVIPIGGDKVLVASRYTHDTVLFANAEKGVAVAKYDLRTMQREALIIFNDYPGWVHEGHCIGFKQMTDGSVYFLYRENGYPAQGVVAVKMDTDLHVEWKRWYKTDIAMAPLDLPIVYEDEQGGHRMGGRRN